MKIFILSVFILTYIFIIALPKYKWLVSGISAIICVSSSLIFGLGDFLSFLTAIDYNVVMMLVGIMVTVWLFAESNMPNKIADKLISKIPNALIAIVSLSVLSGFVSAFIDNVATVLMLAPIGIAVAKKIGVSPIPVVISIAVSSNLQGAATLVGDTTSIMLASEEFANMGFFDFFFKSGRFSIFWAVEIGAILTIPILLIIFRKQNKKLLYESENIEVTTPFYTVLLLLNILLLVVTSFIPDKLWLTNGIICLVIAAVGVVYHTVTFKKNVISVVKESVDHQTVWFLVFLFLIIEAVRAVGIIDDISGFFAGIGNSNIFLLYTVIVFGSVVFSAFIDNIPFVATMLPVVKGILPSLAGVRPELLYFGLLIGATLGGNLSPVGASANVVGIGLLNKEGHIVKNTDFLKIGIPFTLTAVLGGYIFCYLVWGL